MNTTQVLGHRMRQITPFVPCSSLERQFAFYRDCLGFEVGFLAERYAHMRRETVAIRLVEVDPHVDLSHPERQNSFYIDVDGIDALFDELRFQLSTLPRERVRAPFDQFYGQREFHVADEDCTLIFLGEPIHQSHQKSCL